MQTSCKITKNKVTCGNQIKHLFLFSTLREPSVNRKDLLALTIVGPPRDNLELDPLVVLHLNNRLYN